MLPDNNQPLSLFCFVLNKFVRHQRDYSLRLDAMNNVKDYDCDLTMEIADHQQPAFILLIEIKTLGDEYKPDYEPDIKCSFHFALNHRTGKYEIEVDKAKYNVPINNPTGKLFAVFNQAQELFEERVDKLMNYCDNWMSLDAKIKKAEDTEIERNIHEEQLHNSII